MEDDDEQEMAPVDIELALDNEEEPPAEAAEEDQLAIAALPFWRRSPPAWVVEKQQALGAYWEAGM